MIQITVLERMALVEAITDALTEADESSDISQGVIDKLDDALRILGVHREEEG